MILGSGFISVLLLFCVEAQGLRLQLKQLNWLCGSLEGNLNVLWEPNSAKQNGKCLDIYFHTKLKQLDVLLCAFVLYTCQTLSVQLHEQHRSKIDFLVSILYRKAESNITLRL